MFDLKSIFNEMDTAITEACRSKNFAHATAKAEELGMVLESEEKSLSLRYDYRISNSPRDYVIFHFRSYDQSQAFSIQPDMNKFELDLVVDGKGANSRSDSFED